MSQLIRLNVGRDNLADETKRAKAAAAEVALWEAAHADLAASQDLRLDSAAQWVMLWERAVNHYVRYGFNPEPTHQIARARLDKVAAVVADWDEPALTERFNNIEAMYTQVTNRYNTYNRELNLSINGN